MTDQAAIKRVGQWLGQLRRVTSAGKEDVTKEQLADYAIWLAKDFPQSVFIAESAKWMAEQNQYFPAWAILKAALTDWLSAHPIAPRITYRPSGPLAEYIEELKDGTAWHRKQEAYRAQAREDWSDPHRVLAAVYAVGKDHPMRDMCGRMLKMAVAKHAPENLGYLPPEWLENTP